jgi:hypothetical protein
MSVILVLKQNVQSVKGEMVNPRSVYDSSIILWQIWPLLGNGSASTFPQQRTEAELTHVVMKVDPYRQIQYKARFRDNRQATDIFHGYR